MEHRDHVELIRAAVPSQPGVWADLGSGAGAFTLALAELLPAGSRILSIDRDGGVLAEQRRQMEARFAAADVTYRVADFTRDLELPPLDGLLMANSLHFVADKGPLLRRLVAAIRPGGRFVLVEYDADRGNPWVPHPLSFSTWQREAATLGLRGTQLAGRVPSRFLGAIYSAVSVAPGSAASG